MPDDFEVFVETAKVAKGPHKQPFVRFPKRVAESLELQIGNEIEFKVTVPLKESKRETKVELRVKR